MSLKGWVVDKFLGGVIEEKISAQVKERLLAATSVLDKEEVGWRRLTGDATRNLDPIQQDRMFKLAFWLWENNPLAKWLIEITKDFILAEGLPYEAKDENVKAVLDGFWSDPLNQMSIYLEKHVRELFIYGELCLPAFTAQQTGKVRLGYMDPSAIKEVVTDPGNVKMIIGVILKDSADQEGLKLRTILPEGAEEILTSKAKQLRDSYKNGECFFFAINNVTNSPRGRSDLLTTADWLDAYEQFLFDYSEKWPLLNTFVWDLTVEDGSEEDIKKQVKNFTKRSGSIFGHNQKVKAAPMTPDLKSVDAEAGARLFRNHILGPHGYPEHWYGGGGDVNRATAVEMGTPAFKTLSSKQNQVKVILETIFSYVISSARKARYLQVDDQGARAFSVITPELASKDVSKYSTAIQQVVTALATAELQGWIDKESVQKIFALIIGYLGIELDLEAIKEGLLKDGEEKGFEDYKDGKNGNGQ